MTGDSKEEFITKMLEEVLEIKSIVAEIRTIYDAQQKRIDRLERCLFGNGKIGIAQQVALIVASVNFVLFVATNLVMTWVFK